MGAVRIGLRSRVNVAKEQRAKACASEEA